MEFSINIYGINLNILIDLNQILLSGVTRAVKPKQKLNEKEVTLIALSVLRSFRKKFNNYTNVIICCDSQTYWRKTYFPNYKQHRKSDRDKSQLDWETIFKVLNKLKHDLKTYFPYTVLEIQDAEADDIIGTLIPYLYEKNSDIPSLILSSDGDFIQLQKYKNVKQYSPILSAYITEKNPERKLKEKLIKGDYKDGIPNVLSHDNVFVIKKRQSPISDDKLQSWLELDPKDFLSEEHYRNYIRNDMLINFDNIPDNIKNTIINEYETSYNQNGINNINGFNKLKNSNNKIYDYLINNNLTELMEVINEF